MEVVEKNDRVVDDDCSADCVEKARARLPSSRMAEAAFMVAVKVKSKRSSQEPKSKLTYVPRIPISTFHAEESKI